MTKATIADLIRNSAAEQPVDMKNDFAELMIDKLKDALQAKREDVLANYYNSDEDTEPPFDEDDEDDEFGDDEDTSEEDEDLEDFGDIEDLDDEDLEGLEDDEENA